MLGRITLLLAFLLVILCFALPVWSAGLDDLPALLERTGRRIESFAEEFTRVRCTEEVMQARIGANGKVQYQAKSVYDTLMLIRLEGDELTVEESREKQFQSGDAKNLPLLTTNGFSTLALIFHPYFQSSFEFTRAEDEETGDKQLAKLRFDHVKGTRSPMALQMRGHEYPVELSGTAWIRRDSGAIVKITAWLQTSMEDLGLKKFNSEVEYAPVAFPGTTEPYWLPASAKVDVESPRQHWRNVHHFADYRRFSVAIRLGPANEAPPK
jgi:hypothetical protein